MQFIQRVRWPIFTRRARIRRVRAAALFLMRHVGLIGRCHCVLTRDEGGRGGVWLRIETPQLVPLAERRAFETYFRRKLGELGELPASHWDLSLVICDRDELAAPAARARGPVSSRRIAAILRASNDSASPPAPHVEQVRQMRDSVRQRLSARREQRGHSDYAPLRPLPLTDLSPLAEH